MPSIFGILMSVTTTSYRAPSSFLFAASPEVAVSTLCPSRRRAISSISQMERSSSQTRMLPMRSSCRGRGKRARRVKQGRVGLLCCVCLCSTPPLARGEAAQAKHENAALPEFRPCPDLAFVGLDNLIDNRQAQTGAAFELRLERLEHLLNQLLAHAGTGISEIDLPVFPAGLERN